MGIDCRANQRVLNLNIQLDFQVTYYDILWVLDCYSGFLMVAMWLDFDLLKFRHQKYFC